MIEEADIFNSTRVTYAVLLTVALASSAFAQSGSKGYFTIYNNTDYNTVIGFYTNDGDGWSDIWLSERRSS